MKYSYLIIFFFLLQNAYAQRNVSNEEKYTKKYENFFEKKSKLIYIDYYKSEEKTKESYIRKIYNPDKMVMTHFITYKDELFTTKHGRYEERYDNNKLWKTGEYQNNELTGIWHYYNFSNSTVRSGRYKGNLKEGGWVAKDSLGNILNKANYSNGKLNGEYLQYDSAGNLAFRLNYLADSIVSKEIINKTESVFHLDSLDTMPYLKICDDPNGELPENCHKNALLDFIYKKIRYPEIAIEKEIEGQAMFSFVIDEEGKLTDIVTYRGICKEIERECLRVLNKSTEWNPGMKDHQQVKVSHRIPIRFKLN